MRGFNRVNSATAHQRTFGSKGEGELGKLNQITLQPYLACLFSEIMKTLLTHCICLLAGPNKARGCSTNTFVIIKWLNDPLRHCDALMVEGGAFSHKIDYVKKNEDYKSQKASKTQKLFKSCIDFFKCVDFACWWSFSIEGSAIYMHSNIYLEMPMKKSPSSSSYYSTHIILNKTLRELQNAALRTFLWLSMGQIVFTKLFHDHYCHYCHNHCGY